MGRFYFHICNGQGYLEDEEGQECADAEAARRVALASARDIMMSELRDGILNLSSFIEVQEEGGAAFTVPFTDAVKINR
jgi:hypothetical protein